MARMATASKKSPPVKTATARLPDSLVAELERRRGGLARHMARAVVSVVRWDDSTGVPPQRDAIARACEAGLDLFLATAREARPAAPEGMRRGGGARHPPARRSPAGGADPARPR